MSKAAGYEPELDAWSRQRHRCGEMMLALMKEGAAVECLFTNDEEIGYWALELGALRWTHIYTHLDAEEEASYMLDVLVVLR